MMLFMRITLLVLALIHYAGYRISREHDTGYIIFAIYLTGFIVLSGVSEVSRKKKE